ncbi:MAG: hypothetical protein IK078_12390 [Lachnospiraceae bacterium]|nr:hypothetical protein [Lachnospiraceae bacterium]
MGDEIAQVVEMEYKGVYYLLKGSSFLISKMAAGIKFLHEYSHNKWLEKPGSCDWKKIQEASEGSAPILEFPKEMFEESVDITHDPDVRGRGMISPFEYYCRKNNLRYCMMPDLNPEDDYIPVAVLSQEFGIHDEQIKSYMRKRVKAEEDKEKDYDKELSVAQMALEGAEGQAKEEIEKNIEVLQDAKKQNHELLEESKQKMERNNVLDFAEYLKQGEHTAFFDDPEKAKAQLQTCGIVREYMPSECMYPIRDSGKMPEGKKVYYLQQCGEDSYISVERSFEVDENGYVYSVYKAENTEDKDFSIRITDKDCTNSEWSERLREFMKKTGLYMDQPLQVTKDMEGFLDYKVGLSENFTKAPFAGQELSEEAILEIEHTRKNAEMREAFAKSYYSTLTVASDRIMPSSGQILSLELDDGLVEGIDVVKIDSDNAKISIRSDEQYRLVSSDGKEHVITGDEILRAVEKQEKKEEQIRNISRGGR